MKKLFLAAIAASAAMAVSPAAAQTASGSVAVEGTVAAKCSATTPITGTITLNELAQSNGTVDQAFSAQSGGLSRSFTIRCTSANPGLSVNAAPLVNSAIASPASGYTNTVHYTATLVASRAGGGSSDAVIDTSNVSGATTGAVGDRLANSADNVTVTVSNGNTTTGSDLLEAGSYSGSIAIIVSPTA